MSEEKRASDFEQKGYDAWVEQWVQYGCTPTASQCPARWMADGEDRSAFIQGWNRAKREATEEAK